MVAKLLRYPLDTAWAAERTDGRGDGPPDLTDVRFIGALQHPSWANLVRSGSGLDGFDDPRDMVG